MVSKEHVAVWCNHGETVNAIPKRAITPGDVDWLHITEGDVTLEYKPNSTIIYRNSAALTIAVALLCKLLAPNEPEKMYIDLRAALRTRSFITSEIEDIYQTICGAVTNRDYNSAAKITPPAWLNQFCNWLHAYRPFMSVQNRVRGIESFRGSSTMQCMLTRDHEMRIEETRTGVFVELRWPREALSPVEARMTMHVWVRYLGLVFADDIAVKIIGDTHTSIVIREQDLLRIMRYAPCHLHCARVIELRMPVYKMLCQNYMQVNNDGDVGGARLFIRDFLSLFVSNSIPLGIIGEKFTSMLGCFHGILARFIDTLSLHATKPFLDEQVLKVAPTRKDDKQMMKNALPPSYRQCVITPEERLEHVEGFHYGSNTIHTAMLAFFYVGEPHLISVDAVRMLHKIFCQNMSFQARSPSCVHVVNALHQSISAPKQQQIRGITYVRIPSEMYGLVQDDVPPVAYLYMLLVSDLLDSNFAAQMFLNIRLCPRTSKVLSASQSFKPADQRLCGVEGLKKMHREYNTDLPTGMYSSLYTLTNAPGIGCMHYLAFFMEMQTYTQWQNLDCGDLRACQRAFGAHGAAPSSSLEKRTYRGMLVPAHIVRYARRDGRDLQTNNHAYELEANIFQHQVVPVVRFREKERDKDISRGNTENSPLFGADPFVRACLFTMPIDSISVEPLRTFQKRKLAEFAKNMNQDVSLNPKLKHVRLDPSLSVPWGFPEDMFHS